MRKLYDVTLTIAVIDEAALLDGWDIDSLKADPVIGDDILGHALADEIVAIVSDDGRQIVDVVAGKPELVGWSYGPTDPDDDMARVDQERHSERTRA